MAVPEGTLTTADLTTRYRSFAVSIRVGINGFGRIGRLTFRAIYEKFGLDGEVQVVALNDLTDAKTNAHLLELDSNYGPFKGTVATDGNDLVVDGRTIKVFAERDPGSIPWGSENVDIVVESTGFFTDATKAVAVKINEASQEAQEAMVGVLREQMNSDWAKALMCYSI